MNGTHNTLILIRNVRNAQLAKRQTGRELSASKMPIMYHARVELTQVAVQTKLQLLGDVKLVDLVRHQTCKKLNVCQYQDVVNHQHQ